MAKLVFGLNLSLDGYFLTDGDYCSRHLIHAHKYLKTNSTLEQIDYGFELSSTNGLDETFTVSGLTIKSK